MDYLIWLSFIASFVATLLILPYWIIKARKAGLVGKDIHKLDQKPVAEMGGIIVLLGFLIGVLLYIAIRIFIYHTNTHITPILAIFTAILIAGIIGILDDILGWKIGLKQWQKPLLTLLVAAPIVAVNAGSKVMHFPIFGDINLHLLYPLILIPSAILIGTNVFNMLAGYNSLEAGQGIIILTTLAYLSYQTGSPWLTVIALCMVSALAAFWFYNKYPAKIFPGDTLTYSIGALAAILAIFGNFEKALIFLFIPYGIEFFLKFSGKFQKESFSQITQDNTLIPKYKKSYGLEHLAVKFLNKLNTKATERKVVYSIHAFQLIFVIFTIYLYG